MMINRMLIDTPRFTASDLETQARPWNPRPPVGVGDRQRGSLFPDQPRGHPKRQTIIQNREVHGTIDLGETYDAPSPSSSACRNSPPGTRDQWKT